MPDEPVIRIAETDAEIERCFAVMAELRPTLVREDFLGRIRQMEAGSYRLASLERHGRIVTVAGFRVMEMLASGRTLYVDDLVTAEGARSAGNGEAMLGWLVRRAREMDCATFSLDSGTHRQEAHAFYLRHRLRITSFHFALPL